MGAPEFSRSLQTLIVTPISEGCRRLLDIENGRISVLECPLGQFVPSSRFSVDLDDEIWMLTFLMNQFMMAITSLPLNESK